MKDRNLIAIKTNKDIIIGFILFVFLLFSFIYIKTNDFILLITDIITLFLSLKYIFVWLMAPNELIYKKDNKLIIYPDNQLRKTIPISNILSISYKDIANNHSSIIINTKDYGIKINYVKKRKEVCKKINDLIEKYNQDKKYEYNE